jgi:hypothetical protein
MSKFWFALIVSAAGLLAGCGNSPPAAARKPASAYQIAPATQQVPKPPAAGAPAGDPNDIAKNPFVVWVKKAYPGQAASIITNYMKQDGKVDPDRDALRKQALDQAATELNKQVGISLPPGLKAEKAANAVAVSGVTDYQGQKIAVRFEFHVTMLPNGFMKIDVPRKTVYAGSANDSLLVELFGGDIPGKAYAEIIKNLDKEGPPNAKRTPGLTYQKGGVFLIDPGLAFVNMPA